MALSGEQQTFGLLDFWTFELLDFWTFGLSVADVISRRVIILVGWPCIFGT